MAKVDVGVRFPCARDKTQIESDYDDYHAKKNVKSSKKIKKKKLGYI